MTKRHRYPLIPCAPCSGKSRFDLFYLPTVYFNCKYFTSLFFINARAIRMPSRDFNPCGGKNCVVAMAALSTPDLPHKGEKCLSPLIWQTSSSLVNRPGDPAIYCSRSKKIGTEIVAMAASWYPSLCVSFFFWYIGHAKVSVNLHKYFWRYSSFCGLSCLQAIYARYCQLGFALLLIN